MSSISGVKGNPSVEHSAAFTTPVHDQPHPSCNGRNGRHGDLGLSVRLAQSRDECEAIYRLRYQVYIEELGGGERHAEADTTRRKLRDDWDERAYHFYAEQDGEIVACARILKRVEGPFECEEHFDLERFAPAFPDRVAMTSRLVLHQDRRGSHILKQLTCAMYQFLCEHDIQFNFIDCHTRLLPLYSRLGFRAYRPGFNHAQYTYVVPMVLVVDDVEHLEQVRSPFVAIARRYPSSAEGRQRLLAHFPAAAAVSETHRPSPEALLQRLVEHEATRSEMLDGLTMDDVRMLASLGHYVPCRAGDAVLRAGDPGRELFLILDGRFQVTGRIRHSDQEEIQVCKTLAVGDLFGEIRFLTEEIRYASVVAMEPAMLLVLNAKAMDRLVITSPKVAAKVFRNIARIVVSRLCPATAQSPE